MEGLEFLVAIASGVYLTAMALLTHAAHLRELEGRPHDGLLNWFLVGLAAFGVPFFFFSDNLLVMQFAAITVGVTVGVTVMWGVLSAVSALVGWWRR